MPIVNTQLWVKISSFEIDDCDSEFKLSNRLARENGWSADYTFRVIEEYKRFIYLCCEAGHPVTPSDEVDQVWHLHLCYSRSYWHDLCRDVLGKAIHHGPTKGGKEERHKYRDWYEKTLTAYQKHFGDKPPVDIWPSCSSRFANVAFSRVDHSQYLIIPRRRVLQVAVAGGMTVALAGCTTMLASYDHFEGLMAFAVVTFIVVIGILIKIGKGGGNGGGCGGDSGCGGSGCGGGCGGCGG